MDTPKSVTPMCVCHGEPMYWHKGCGMLAGGLWRCRIRKREIEQVRTDKTRARDLRHYHAPNGGYVRRRRNELQASRERILDQLAQLKQEAQTLVEP